MTSVKFTGTLAVLSLLAACAEPEIILPGERLDTRADLDSEIPFEEPVNRAASISLPGVTSNTSWTHRAGSATHKMPHVSLRGSLAEVWSASIGQGDTRRARITADPVVLNNRIFTIDSESKVSAFNTGGGELWSVSVLTGNDNSNEVSGGGLAISENVLIVGTGFGRLVALDAATGGEIWEQRLNTQISGPPSIANGLVYISTRDSRGWAINLKNGKIEWQVQGAPAVSGVSGGAGPAVNGEIAVFPLGGTELLGTFPKGGIRLWSASASGLRKGEVYATTADITSDPVIDGKRVYVGSQAGRLVALDIGSGERLWTAKEGAYTPALPMGGSVFVVSDQNQLLRLNASTGERIWGVKLPYYKKDLANKRRDVFAHFGPIMAGGRLIVASGDGQIRSFNPESGALISSVAIDGGVTANPAVAGGTLYVVSRKGKLHAFR